VTSEPPAGAPGADTPADGGSVVAMLLGDGLQLDPRAGTPRLPRVPDTDWDDHEERLLGHPTAVPMAPAHGLAGPPGRRLFLMAVRGPVEERVAVLPLDRLDDLDEDAEVVSVVLDGRGPVAGRATAAPAASRLVPAGVVGRDRGVGRRPVGRPGPPPDRAVADREALEPLGRPRGPDRSGTGVRQGHLRVVPPRAGAHGDRGQDGSPEVTAGPGRRRGAGVDAHGAPAGHPAPGAPCPRPAGGGRAGAGRGPAGLAGAPRDPPRRRLPRPR
jgi:hypothetical protein